MYRSPHHSLKLFLWLCLICSTEQQHQHQHHRDKRIAGGIRQTSHLSLLVVSLRARSEQMYFGDSHFCSGCMLNDIFVLTSAQCVTNRHKVALQPRDFIVMGGNVFRLNSTTGAIPMVVDFLAVHVNFTMTSYSDIAILRTQPFHGAYYAPGLDVAIEMIVPPPFGAKCVTLGWGRLFKVSVVPPSPSFLAFSMSHCLLRMAPWPPNWWSLKWLYIRKSIAALWYQKWKTICSVPAMWVKGMPQWAPVQVTRADRSFAMVSWQA